VVVVDNPVNQFERLAEQPPAEVNEDGANYQTTNSQHSVSKHVEGKTEISVVPRHCYAPEVVAYTTPSYHEQFC